MTGIRDKDLVQAKICVLESIIIEEDSDIVIASVKIDRIVKSRKQLTLWNIYFFLNFSIDFKMIFW